MLFKQCCFFIYFVNVSLNYKKSSTRKKPTQNSKNNAMLTHSTNESQQKLFIMHQICKHGLEKFCRPKLFTTTLCFLILEQKTQCFMLL